MNKSTARRVILSLRILHFICIPSLLFSQENSYRTKAIRDKTPLLKQRTVDVKQKDFIIKSKTLIPLVPERRPMKEACSCGRRFVKGKDFTNWRIGREWKNFIMLHLFERLFRMYPECHLESQHQIKAHYWRVSFFCQNPYRFWFRDQGRAFAYWTLLSTLIPPTCLRRLLILTSL